jgi:NADH dehydrogenase [ubiquinone] 1 alpha subcomplex assembly factor 7
LSAHVDFAALGAVATETGACVQGPVTQGAFLKSLGIEVRARRLCEGANAKSRGEIAAALARLTMPRGMGRLFKAMALRSPGTPELEGFA